MDGKRGVADGTLDYILSTGGKERRESSAEAGEVNGHICCTLDSHSA